MKMKTCEHCKHFEPQFTLRGKKRIRDMTGLCRLNPPVFVESYQVNEFRNDYIFRSPYVRVAIDWCSNFLKKDENA
jgi:hypothetical protein